MNIQQVTNWFLNKLHDLQPNNKNIVFYKKWLPSLTDEEFDTLMEELKEEKKVLPFYCANLEDTDVPLENSLKVAKDLGLDIFQQLWFTDPVSGVRFLTPEKYFVIHLPVRRQVQHIEKGKSVVENSEFTDSLTGQPTGVSKSVQISLPELLTLDSLGLHNSIQELINVRGGNEVVFKEARRSVINTGSFSLKRLEETNTRPTSVETLRSFLLSMHIDSTL